MIYGIGYGQASWQNEHFTSAVERDAKVAELRAQVEKEFTRRYGKIRTHVSVGDAGKYIVIMNVTQTGADGRNQYSMRLYESPTPHAEAPGPDEFVPMGAN